MPAPVEPQVTAVAERWRQRQPVAVGLEGFHAVKHALRFGARVGPLLTTDLDRTLALAGSHAPDLVDQFAALTETVERATLLDLVGRVHPTGVAALADRPEHPVAAALAALSAHRPTPAVFLDHPRNLGNLGAVIRVAAGLGASAVLSDGDVDPWHPGVLRGSAGLHFALPVARVAAVEEVAGPLFALDAAGTDLRQTRIPDNAVLAFGSERHGLSPQVRDRADALLALPMRELVSSYNLTTSVAMTLYHWALGR